MATEVTAQANLLFFFHFYFLFESLYKIYNIYFKKAFKFNCGSRVTIDQTGILWCYSTYTCKKCPWLGPPSSQKPSGTGTHYPWKWWRPPPLMLSCQGYQTEQLPTVPPPPPPPPPVTDFLLIFFYLSRPVQQWTSPVTSARIVCMLIVGP